jgi:hypothetical protein
VEPVAHEVGSAGQGKLLPHGLSALRNPPAPLHLKTSHDPSAWGCDSVAWWGEPAGRVAPPQAPRRLGLGDGGGSHSATPSLCKDDLPGLAHRLGLEMRVAHWPPDCAKPNPSEHPGCPPITRACQGVLCHTGDMARPCIERPPTTTGLQGTVRMRDTVSPTGRTYPADLKQNMQIVFDDYLPKWNYRAVPEGLGNRELVGGQFLR